MHVKIQKICLQIMISKISLYIIIEIILNGWNMDLKTQMSDLRL